MIAGKLILSNILYKARIHSNHDVQQISHHPWFSIRITLFDMPTDHVGMPYAKGGDYLTITFLESCWTREKIENGLEGLAKLRVQTSRDKLTLRAFMFWEDSKVMDTVC